MSNIQPYPIPTVCRYCGAPVVYSSNAAIYGKQYGSGFCYMCTKCDAYVGVHKNSRIPMGMLADEDLRGLKQKCHALFDPVWKGSKRISREQAYGRLAAVLGIPVSECHFGFFDTNRIKECLKVLNRDRWYVGVNWK